jgi:hypothetical protein
VAGAEFIHVSARTLYAKPHRQAPFSAILPTPFGALGIIADAEYLREIIFLPGSAAALQPSGIPAEKAVEQLARYLADPDYRFDLPLAEQGSHFRRRTWAAIGEIPAGRHAPTASSPNRSAASPAPSARPAETIRFPSSRPAIVSSRPEG